MWVDPSVMPANSTPNGYQRREGSVKAGNLPPRVDRVRTSPKANAYRSSNVGSLRMSDRVPEYRSKFHIIASLQILYAIHHCQRTPLEITKRQLTSATFRNSVFGYDLITSAATSRALYRDIYPLIVRRVRRGLGSSINK